MEIDIFHTTKKYNVIYADPPWQYKDRGCNGACNKHYNTLTVKDICNLPIKQIAEKDSVLFLWATYPMLPEVMQVINAWGFTYKTIGFQWVKQNKSGTGDLFGLGRWTRGNTEPCFIAVKGKPHPLVKNNSISQLIKTPVKSHSEKPEEVREKIDTLIPGVPKIELFARKNIANWDAWGNEVGALDSLKETEALAYTE